MPASFALWWRGFFGTVLCVAAFLGAAAGLASSTMGAWSVGAVASLGTALTLWWAYGFLARERAAIELLRDGARRLLRSAGAEPPDTQDASVAGVERLMRLAEGALVSRLDDAASQSGDVRSLLDAVEDAVIAFDAAGLVRMTNRAADEFFERSHGQLLGRSIDELFSQADLISLYSDAARGEAAHGQVRIARGGGVRTYLVAATPFDLTIDHGASRSERRPVALTLEDVTEFAASVQHKTEFVANASHELRTPLASIRGAADTLMDGADDDPAMSRRLLAMISTNARRLEELVSDLSDLSRLESPEAAVVRSAVNLRELGQSIAALFERACSERSLTLQFDIAPEVERIESDPRLVALILKNLVENATKFANESTPIIVAASTTPGATGLRLRVIDRGIGIPLSAQSRIFERFYQVDPSRSGQAHRRGTGLGLAIVKHAVKTLGGTISVSSVWKEGTTMTVELPACVPSTESVNGTENGGSRHSSGNGE